MAVLCCIIAAFEGAWGRSATKVVSLIFIIHRIHQNWPNRHSMSLYDKQKQNKSEEKASFLRLLVEKWASHCCEKQYVLDTLESGCIKLSEVATFNGRPEWTAHLCKKSLSYYACAGAQMESCYLAVGRKGQWHILCRQIHPINA